MEKRDLRHEFINTLYWKFHSESSHSELHMLACSVVNKSIYVIRIHCFIMTSLYMWTCLLCRSVFAESLLIFVFFEINKFTFKDWNGCLCFLCGRYLFQKLFCNMVFKWTLNFKTAIKSYYVVMLVSKSEF